MPGTNLFFYKMLFVAEIVLAEFLFMFKLKKRKLFALRFCGGALAAIGLAAAFPVVAGNVWYSSFMFIVLFALTVPMLKLCFKEPWTNILFCALAAYTLQHLAYGLTGLVMSLISQGASPLYGLYAGDGFSADFRAFNREAVFNILIYFLCYCLSYGVLYLLFNKRIQKDKDMRVKSIFLLWLIAVGILANVILNSVLIYAETDFISSVVNSATNLLCCCLLLYGQFNLLHIKELQVELDIIQRLRHQEKEQYFISKENIELINLKCHDMRHQIRRIGENKSIAPETVKEIEDAISVYRLTAKTGNEALDVILTENNLRCYKNGITLTCVADGARLEFMHDADIYSLFGNALDNAIEAVLKIRETDSRVIGLKIHSVGELITINIRNSYADAITYNKDGYPVSTKGEPNYHGYGIKSISYIVEKYGGNLSISAKDGVFNLNILLSIPE